MTDDEALTPHLTVIGAAKRAAGTEATKREGKRDPPREEVGP